MFLFLFTSIRLLTLLSLQASPMFWQENLALNNRQSIQLRILRICLSHLLFSRPNSKILKVICLHLTMDQFYGIYDDQILSIPRRPRSTKPILTYNSASSWTQSCMLANRIGVSQKALQMRSFAAGSANRLIIILCHVMLQYVQSLKRSETCHILSSWRARMRWTY